MHYFIVIKRAVSLCLITFCSHMAYASPIYVGGGVVGSVLSGNQSLQIRNTIAQRMLFKNYGLRDTSISGEAFVGGGYSCYNWYVGVEFLYSFLKVKSELRSRIAGNHEELLQTKLGNGSMVSLRFGYSINTALLYVRLGVEERRLNISFNDEDDELVSVNKSYRSRAPIVGLGAEFHVAKQISLRLEGRGAFYPNKHYSVVRDALNYTHIKTRPRLYSLTLGICYKF